MVSRRNFFSICVMMLTILTLFQLLTLSRDFANNFNENSYLTETSLTSDSAWNEQLAGDLSETVVYIGNDAAEADIIRQWCTYTKRLFKQLDSFEDYTFSEDGAALLCLNEKSLNTEEQVSDICAMVQSGQNVLFCNMSDPSLLTALPSLKSLLGIREVASEQVELTGIKLFSGFLLGGETVYLMEDERQKSDQEIDPSVPWYLRASGTKSYMVGMTEDEDTDNENLPSLIWRNSYGDGRVFVINGPYMQDETGMGILSAVMYELNDYDLYPVVNAQNLSIVNFPVFASENTDMLTQIYSRNLSNLQGDLMWPGLISALNKGGYRVTGFMTTRLDYSSGWTLSSNSLTFYLKQFKEQDAEVGLSFDHISEISLKDKLAEDQAFFDYSGTSYSYGSAYVPGENRDDFLAAEHKGILENIRTITGDWDDGDLLSYCSDTVIAQGTTADGFSHPYLQDLKVKALETSLGYSNILLNMKRVIWPDENDSHWEVLSDSFSRNINTYWNKFSAFDKTTLLESDKRIRAFLALDYSDMRREDTVTVEITSGGEDNWFILRTHDEVIAEIDGGDYIEIEENAYLIHATEKNLQIRFEERQNKQPFLS